MDQSSYVQLDSFYTWPKDAGLERKLELAAALVLPVSEVSSVALSSFVRAADRGSSAAAAVK
jgi:hypothetical protein